MATSERVLVAVLRVFGGLSLLATVAVFMPLAWMDACHAWLGLGPLPQGPIVEYLARSTSALYAMMGGLVWLAAGDPRRYERVIAYLAAIVAVLGVVIGVVDLRLGMPLLWTLGEGPGTVLMGLVLRILLARARASWRREDAAAAPR